MEQKWMFLGGMATGAAVMFVLDPSAKRRRALLRDQTISASRKIARFSEKASRDLFNRGRGIASELVGRLRSDHPSGEILAARVRSRIGRAVSAPGAIQVLVNDGRVTLRGPVLASELETLLSRAGAVRGVDRVINELSVHEDRGRVPALQSRRRWSGLTGWSPAARLISSVAAGTAAVFAIAKRVA